MIFQFLLLVVLVAIGVTAVNVVRRYAERPGRDPLTEAETYLARGRKGKAVKVIEAARRRYPSRTDVARTLEALKRDRVPLPAPPPARSKPAFPRVLIIAIFVVTVLMSLWQRVGHFEGVSFFDAKRLATDAYYQLESDPLNRDQVAQAVVKIQIARVLDPRKPGFISRSRRWRWSPLTTMAIATSSRATTARRLRKR